MDIDVLLEAGGSLYQTRFAEIGITLTYRLLTLKEYRVFSALRASGDLDPAEIAEMAFGRCYLGTAALLTDSLPAGLTVTVGNLILHLSGDAERTEELLEQARALYPQGSLYEHMRAVIMTAFSYRMEDMESWTQEDFIRRFAIAENVLRLKVPGYEPLDPKKITRGGQPQRQGINFEAENRALRQSESYWEHQATQRQLDEEQLRKLSHRRPK